MKSNVEESRNAMGKLIAKVYRSEDMIEIEVVVKGCRSRFILPPGTLIQFDPGTLPTKQAASKAKK